VAAAFLVVLRRRETAPTEAPAVREGVVSERPLDTLTRDELYELAKELDIPGRSKMKKLELKDAVSRAGRSG
jgi:hypothetical protein